MISANGYCQCNEAAKYDNDIMPQPVFLFLEVDMSEVKFTKGKWEVHKYTSAVNGISRVFAYEVWSGNNRIVNRTEVDYPCEEIKTELLANAYLIAAAPDMYAMLEEIVETGELDQYQISDRIDKLLAKARGE